MYVERSLVVPVDGRLKRNGGVESAIRGWSRDCHGQISQIGERRVLGTDEVQVPTSIAAPRFGGIIVVVGIGLV
jgi:hypothetical protein